MQQSQSLLDDSRSRASLDHVPSVSLSRCDSSVTSTFPASALMYPCDRVPCFTLIALLSPFVPDGHRFSADLVSRFLLLVLRPHEARSRTDGTQTLTDAGTKGVDGGLSIPPILCPRRMTAAALYAALSSADVFLLPLLLLLSNLHACLWSRIGRAQQEKDAACVVVRSGEYAACGCGL